jgi:hypothetical protein
MRTSTPLHGVHTDSATNETWLVLEYLEDGMRVNKVPDPRAMGLAAAWIGRFHADSEQHVGAPVGSFLGRYDEPYYLGWIRRTVKQGAASMSGSTWLDTLSHRLTPVIDALIGAPQVIIHGEYYPKNILYRRGTIVPVDWEGAAVAPGEIDLACLTEKWGPETVELCEQQYCMARWGGTPPADFDRIMSAARLHVQLRWLGDSPEGPLNPDRLRVVQAEAERLGLL